MVATNGIADGGKRVRWRILHLEDDPHDRELVRLALTAEDIVAEFTYADSREEFSHALAQGKFDLVLSDFTLPGYDGTQALMLAREKDPDLPYIFVSGTIGEERAVDSMKNGATDYVLKDRLQRLLPAIRRALREVEERKMRRTAEGALRESEERYRLLFERHPHPMWVYDVESLRFLAVNEAAVRHYGYSREEFLAMTIVDIRPPEDVPQLMAELRAMPPAFQPANTWRHRKKGGALIDVAITGHELPFAGRAARVVTALDVSERKALQAQLDRANRVESVGRLASGIAHDMNNILAPIMMSAPLLRDGLPPVELERIVNTIEISAKRGADLVRQLLMFGRGVEGARGPVQWRNLVRELTNMTAETFPKNIKVTFETAPGTWAVRGDASQLYQVVLNLCVNARDAMPRGGTLSLTSVNFHADENYAAMHPDARVGDYVRLTVTDSGTGIPPEILERIFDPFFTTKEVGHGTGLGLSTVLGIVKSHGGFIHLLSEVHRGTTVEVYLPALPENMTVATDSVVPAPSPRGHGELILVVDDEESIRSVLCEMLRRQNYRTMAAANGNEAMAILARHLSQVRLVITDLEMQVMDGVSLIRGLRRMKPRLPVLISTGIGSANVARERTEELAALGITTILKKPYAGENIFNEVHRAVMDG